MSSSQKINQTSVQTGVQDTAPDAATFSQWPPTPPNSEGFRSTVQTTIRRSAEELGLPPGVPAPVIAIPPTPGLPTWPPHLTATGVQLALPDLVLPPGVRPPWDENPPHPSAPSKPPVQRLLPPPVVPYNPRTQGPFIVIDS